ncbi:DNA recombination/repair protein RecA, partial [Streptomyces sp. NPDC050147]
IDMGVENGFVRKAGAWYTYEGDQLGQGKENARNFLKDNPDLANEIERKIKEKLGVGVKPQEEEPTAEAGKDEKAGAAPEDAAKTVPAPATKATKPKAAAAKS